MGASAKTYNIYGITAILAVSGTIMGLEASSLAAFLTAPQFYDYFGPLTKWDEKLIAASSAIGAAMGSIVSGGLCDAVGCIKTFQAAGFIWLLGTTIVIFSPYIHVIVLGRVIKGFAMGKISSVVPVYISETIPSNRKGSSISIVHLCSTLATLSLYYIGYFLQNILVDDSSFKYTWALESIPALMLLVLSLFLPESPKWLALQSRWEDAAKNLGRIERYQSQKLGVSRTRVQNRGEIGDKSYVIQAYTAGPEIRNCTFADLFSKRYWRYTLIGMITQSFAQLTCVSIMTYFFFYICNLCGLEGEHIILVVSIQYALSALFTIFPVFFLDNCRRKDSLTFGMFILSLAYFALCALNTVYGEKVVNVSLDNGSPFGWQLRREPASAMLALCFFLISVYASLIISVSWLYTGEIFPGPARSKGSSVCMFVSWITNGSLTLIFPSIIKSIGPYFFCVLGVICLCGSLIFSQLPESRELTELQIESLYGKPSPTLEQINSYLDNGEMSDRISQQSDISAKTDKTSLFRDKQIYEEIKSSFPDQSPNYSGETATGESPEAETSKFEDSETSPATNDIYDKQSSATNSSPYGYEIQRQKSQPRKKSKGDGNGRHNSDSKLPALEPQTTATEFIEAYTALDSFSTSEKPSEDGNEKEKDRGRGRQPEKHKGSEQGKKKDRQQQVDEEEENEEEEEEEEECYSSDWLEDSGNYSPLREINAASQYRDYDPSHELPATPDDADNRNRMEYGASSSPDTRHGHSFEPTNFLQFDNLKYPRRENFIDRRKINPPMEFDYGLKPNRSNMNGGKFINAKGYNPGKKGRR